MIRVAPEIRPERMEREVGAGRSPYSWKLESLARGFLGFLAFESEETPARDVLLAEGRPTGLVLSELSRRWRVSEADDVLRYVRPRADTAYGPGSVSVPSSSDEYPKASSDGKVISNAESRLGEAGALRLMNDCNDASAVSAICARMVRQSTKSACLPGVLFNTNTCICRRIMFTKGQNDRMISAQQWTSFERRCGGKIVAQLTA